MSRAGRRAHKAKRNKEVAFQKSEQKSRGRKSVTRGTLVTEDGTRYEKRVKVIRYKATVKAQLRASDAANEFLEKLPKGDWKSWAQWRGTNRIGGVGSRIDSPDETGLFIRTAPLRYGKGALSGTLEVVAMRKVTSNESVGARRKTKKIRSVSKPTNRNKRKASGGSPRGKRGNTKAVARAKETKQRNR